MGDFFAVVRAARNRVAAEEKRHIHADLSAKSGEFGIGESEFFGIVQVEENGCRVAGRSTKAALERDVFMDGDFIGELAACVGFEKAEGVEDGVVFRFNSPAGGGF